MAYKMYRIYCDGEPTANIYEAEDEKYAIEQYKKFCFADYCDKCGDYPDEDTWNNGMEISAFDVAEEV